MGRTPDSVILANFDPSAPVIVSSSGLSGIDVAKDTPRTFLLVSQEPSGVSRSLFRLGGLLFRLAGSCSCSGRWESPGSDASPSLSAMPRRSP